MQCCIFVVAVHTVYGCGLTLSYMINVCCCSVAVFHGHINSTFYVKAVLSPDDKYLLSGSSDGKAYIWQVSRPRSEACVLQGHVNEVTGVDWCRTDVSRLVTLSDDNVVWIWRVDHRDSTRDGSGVIGRTTRTAYCVGKFSSVIHTILAAILPHVGPGAVSKLVSV